MLKIKYFFLVSLERGIPINRKNNFWKLITHAQIPDYLEALNNLAYIPYSNIGLNS